MDGCVEDAHGNGCILKPLGLYNFDNAFSYISSHTLWPWDASYDACPHAHDYITLFINQPFMQKHQENKAFSFLWVIILPYQTLNAFVAVSVMIF